MKKKPTLHFFEEGDKKIITDHRENSIENRIPGPAYISDGLYISRSKPIREWSIIRRAITTDHRHCSTLYTVEYGGRGAITGVTAGW